MGHRRHIAEAVVTELGLTAESVRLRENLVSAVPLDGQGLRLGLSLRENILREVAAGVEILLLDISSWIGDGRVRYVAVPVLSVAELPDGTVSQGLLRDAPVR